MNHPAINRPRLFVVPAQNTMSITCSPTPFAIVGKAPPRRPPNKKVRSREYLLIEEIDAMRVAARSTRYPIRDEALIVVGYRHGLRCEEIVGLRWTDIDLQRKTILIQRVKGEGQQSHCLADDEAMLLFLLPRNGAYVFQSERNEQLSKRGAHDIVAKLGALAGLSLTTHPHMLRHTRGHILANRGEDTRAIQEFLGHRCIRSTQIYTELAHGRTRGLELD